MQGAGAERLIDEIYEAAVVADAWPMVLQGLAEHVAGAGGALVTLTGDRYGGWRLSPGLGPEAEAYLRSDAPQRSQSVARLLSSDWTGFLTDQDLFETEADYEADPLCAEWALPNGWYRGTGTAIQVPNGDMAIFQLHRRVGDPAFGPQDIQTLNALRPHLARASVLSIRWREERLRSATQALELLGLPAAVVDRTGRVLSANRLIEAMTGHFIWAARDRLGVLDPAASSALGRILETGFADGAVGSFPARSGAGRDPVVLHVLPIAGMARDLFGSGLSMVVVTRPDSARQPDASLIQGLFDLTPAEARVAAALIEGRTIADMAARNGVGLETVRTQVKSILAKTGVSRQAEFVARFRSAELPGHPMGG